MVISSDLNIRSLDWHIVRSMANYFEISIDKYTIEANNWNEETMSNQFNNCS